MRKQPDFMRIPPPRILGGFDYEPVTPPASMQVPAFDDPYYGIEEAQNYGGIPQPGNYSALAGINPNSLTDDIARIEEDYRRELRRLDNDPRFSQVDPAFRETQLPLPQPPGLDSTGLRVAGRDSAKKALLLASLFGAAGAPLAGLTAANRTIDTSTQLARQSMLDDFERQRISADFESRQADRIARNDSAYNQAEVRRVIAENNRRSADRRKTEGEIGDNYSTKVRAATTKAQIDARTRQNEANNKVAVIRSQIGKIGMLTPQAQEELARNISDFMGSEYASIDHFRDMPADVAARIMVQKDGNSIRREIAKLNVEARKSIASDKLKQAEQHFDELMRFRNDSLAATREHRAAQAAISAIRASKSGADKRYDNAKSTAIRLEKQASAIQQNINRRRGDISRIRKQLVDLHKNDAFMGTLRNQNPFLDRLNDTGLKLGERLVESLEDAIRDEKADTDRYSAKLAEVSAAITAAQTIANEQANSYGVQPYNPVIDPSRIPGPTTKPPSGFKGTNSVADLLKGGKVPNFYGKK